ncbi:MAG: EI24 domain-containing protein, partial [Rhizobium rhizophilum]
MIFDAAALSLRNLFAPETRNVFWKTLGLTILVLIGLWFGLRESFIAFIMPLLQGFIPDLPDWAGWLTFIFGILASIGLALGLALLLSPVTAIIAGLFLDDVAEVVEKRDYASDPPGKAMPTGQAIIASIKF